MPVLLPCAHAQYLHVIIVSTKVARSQDMGILASVQWCHAIINGEKSSILNFKSHDKSNEHYKLNRAF